MSRNNFILLYLVISLIPKGITTAKNKEGFCEDSTKNEKCCISHYLENGTCKVCPSGWYGENCTQQCTQNTFGELCRGKCNCISDEKCHPVKGCISKGVCLENNGKFKCCNNYVQRVRNKCSACLPGTFGFNCSKKCPDRKYGHLCLQECNCNPGVTCDKRFGCVDQNSSHKNILFLVGLSTSLIVITLVFLIMMLKIRGVKFYTKCGELSPTDHRPDELLPVSHIPCKGDKVKGRKQTCQAETLTTPIRSSMNNWEKISVNEGSNGEMEAGFYNTLALRVIGYDELATLTRHSIVDRHSDASSTCSRTKYLSDFLNSGEVTSDDESFRRASSFYLQNYDYKDNTMQTFHHNEPENRENKDSISNYSDVYNYDEAEQFDKGMTGELNSKNLLMKELSCQLMNINKN